MIYRIYYPNNYDPDVEHPVIVWQSGSRNLPEYPGDPTIVQYPSYLSQIANDYNSFIIVPELKDCDGGYDGEINDVLWLDYSSSYYNKIYPEPVLGNVYVDDGIGWVGVGARHTLDWSTKDLYTSCFGPDNWFMRAFCSLMKDFNDANFLFYNRSDFSDHNSITPPVNIDYNRIYYIGYSYGVLKSIFISCRRQGPV